MLCSLYMFTSSVSYVTFGITGDTTCVTTQESEAVKETTPELSEGTPHDVV